MLLAKSNTSISSRKVVVKTFAVNFLLRRVGARTPEALEEAIAQALLTITAQDAQGWFQHCGYALPDERKS